MLICGQLGFALSGLPEFNVRRGPRPSAWAGELGTFGAGGVPPPFATIRTLTDAKRARLRKLWKKSFCIQHAVTHSLDKTQHHLVPERDFFHSLRRRAVKRLAAGPRRTDCGWNVSFSSRQPHCPGARPLSLGARQRHTDGVGWYACGRRRRAWFGLDATASFGLVGWKT